MKAAFSKADPDLVSSLYTGIYKPQIFRIALSMDVFTPLAAGPADAQTVARACGCQAAGMQLLLEYLCSLELIERRGEAYALTPSASTFFVRGAESCAADWILMDTGPEWWAGVERFVRSGERFTPPWPWEQYAWLESYRGGRYEESLEMWRAASLAPGGLPNRRLLDLACGCAIKSLSLALADPSLAVTCIDSAPVLEVAHSLAERLGILPQVTFQEGDITSLDLSEDFYHAALLGKITFYLSERENIDLFQRVQRALVRDGVLVIDAIMAGSENAQVSAMFNLLIAALGEGAVHSFEDYQGWLDEAGFRQVDKIGERRLLAAKR